MRGKLMPQKRNVNGNPNAFWNSRINEWMIVRSSCFGQNSCEIMWYPLPLYVSVFVLQFCDRVPFCELNKVLHHKIFPPHNCRPTRTTFDIVQPLCKPSLCRDRKENSPFTIQWVDWRARTMPNHIQSVTVQWWCFLSLQNSPKLDMEFHRVIETESKVLQCVWSRNKPLSL